MTKDDKRGSVGHTPTPCTSLTSTCTQCGEDVEQEDLNVEAYEMAGGIICQGCWDYLQEESGEP